MVLSQPVRRILLAALLLLFLGRIAVTWRVFNDTVDEPGHLSAGLQLLQTGRYTYEPEHPPLGRLLLAALPYLAGLRYHPVLWAHDGPWSTHELAFYWKTLALARAANLLFAVLLFLTVWRWSRLLHGDDAGLAACALLVCCPNVLALAAVATLDFAAAVAVVVPAFFLWRWSEDPGWRRALAAGLAAGLAVLTKFSSLVLLPPLALLYFVWARRFPVKQVAAALVLAALVVWAGYRFETGHLAPAGHSFRSKYSDGQTGGLPLILTRWFQHRTLPAPLLFHGLIDIASHNRVGHNAYLLGHTHQYGWWYYFPVAILLKTTLPLLLLAGLGVLRRLTAAPLAAAALLVAVAMTGNLNIGVRHVLAVYPFFTLLAAPLFGQPGRRRAAALVLLAWHAGESFRAHPDYLPYFNQWARGREHRYLADSNLDWGQDLARLARYARERRLGPLQLSYFGQADPAKFGLSYRRLDWGKPDRGWIAISVNHLVGIQNDPAPARWLWHLEPRVKIGQSLWLYYFDK
jgi:4-amino-4-deoxy-L-arabinose transferase-like glycosyltransferase